jgi:hypothetical protein
VVASSSASLLNNDAPVVCKMRQFGPFFPLQSLYCAAADILASVAIIPPLTFVFPIQLIMGSTGLHSSAVVSRQCVNPSSRSPLIVGD